MARTQERPTTKNAPIRVGSRGPVMAIGGAEDKSGAKTILTRFVDLAGGKAARIVIIPTASEERDTGDDYAALFAKLGAERTDVLRIERREDANGDEAVGLVRDATGVFITGGDQMRLVAYLCGTRTVECIRQRNADGVIVAGTSAGASIVGAHMIGEGGGGDEPPRKGMVDMIAGFGLLQDVIIDQHFSARGRIGRLLSLFAANPGLVGVGLDEDTAMIVGPDDRFEVIGSKSAIVVDGRNTRSDYFEREDGEILTVTDSSFHVLPSGRWFDLAERRLVSDEGLPS